MSTDHDRYRHLRHLEGEQVRLSRDVRITHADGSVEWLEPAATFALPAPPDDDGADDDDADDGAV